MEINNPFAIIYEKVCDSFLKRKHSMYSFQTYDFNKNQKFSVIKQFGENEFNLQLEGETFLQLVQKSQNILHFFKKFYFNHCAKKMIQYECNHDLNLNPLYLLNNKQKFSFSQDNTKFTLSVIDMVKIIKNNLLNHDRFFSQPIFPRNPYTNIEFPEHILYNFYFHLTKHNYKIPEILHRFFYCGLNLSEFSRKNSFLIRELIIDNYPRELTMDELYEEIIMCLRIIKPQGLFIHVNFPKNIVNNTMIKYYLCYLHSRLDNNEESRSYHRRKLQKELLEFVNSENVFGIYWKERYKVSTNNGNYRITNLLSHLIPNFDHIEEVIQFMEHGHVGRNNWGIMDIPMVRDFFENDEESDDEETDDDEENLNYDEIDEIMRDLNIDT